MSNIHPPSMVAYKHPANGLVIYAAYPQVYGKGNYSLVLVIDSIAGECVTFQEMDQSEKDYLLQCAKVHHAAVTKKFYEDQLNEIFCPM